MNLYAYVQNNPVNFIDPWGLENYSYYEGAMQIGAVGPFDAMSANTLAEEALTDAQNSNLPGQHNGPADAYRHCVWSCKMTDEIGENQAADVANIHEECGNNPPGETAMDLHNNELGRSVGGTGGNCKSKCRGLLNMGLLQTAPGGTPPNDIY